MSGVAFESGNVHSPVQVEVGPGGRGRVRPEDERIRVSFWCLQRVISYQRFQWTTWKYNEINLQQDKTMLVMNFISTKTD